MKNYSVPAPRQAFLTAYASFTRALFLETTPDNARQHLLHALITARTMLCLHSHLSRFKRCFHSMVLWRLSLQHHHLILHKVICHMVSTSSIEMEPAATAVAPSASSLYYVESNPASTVHSDSLEAPLIRRREDDFAGSLPNKDTNRSLRNVHWPYSLSKTLSFVSLVPLSSVAISIFMLIGIPIFVHADISKQYLTANWLHLLAITTAAGAVGGAIWAVVALVIIGLLHSMSKIETKTSVLWGIGCFLVFLGVIVAPPAGVEILTRLFRAETLDPLNATYCSVIGFVILVVIYVCTCFGIGNY